MNAWLYHPNYSAILGFVKRKRNVLLSLETHLFNVYQVKRKSFQKYSFKCAMTYNEYYLNE